MDEYVILVSKVAGIMAAVMASLMKFPQVSRLYNAKTDRGISFLSLVVELYCFTLGAIYGYLKALPISTFGETILLSAQSLIIILMVLVYRKESMYIPFVVMLYLFFIIGVLNSPEVVLIALFTMILPVVVLGKGAQIMALYKAQSAGAVSLSTWALATFCCFCRVITTAVEVKDFGMLLNYGIALVLNLVVVYLIIIYQRKDAKVKKGL